MKILLILTLLCSQLIEINDKNVKQFKSSIQDKYKIEFSPQKLPKTTFFSNAALVRFDQSGDNQLIWKSTQFSILQIIIQYLFPFYVCHSQYKINQKQIVIQIASQPSDIRWQNVGCSQIYRILRKISISVLSKTLLIVTSTFTISLSLGVQTLINIVGYQLYYLNILTIIFILMFNSLIKLIISQLIKLIKFDTYTDEQSQQLISNAINQSLSLGFMFIFAPIFGKFSTYIQFNTSTYTGFPQLMLTTIIVQSFISNTVSFMLQYLSIYGYIARLLNRQKFRVLTQIQMHDAYKGSPVPFTDMYAYMVIIVWCSFIYAIVSPVCVLIGGLGMLLSYLYERILFNSRYSIPAYNNSRINSVFIDLLDATPLLVAVFNYLFYVVFQESKNHIHDPRAMGMIIFNIVLAAIHAILPWRKIIQYFYLREDKIFTKLKYQTAKIQQKYERYCLLSQHLTETTQKQHLISQFNKPERRKINIQEYIHEAKGGEDTIAELQCCKH